MLKENNSILRLQEAKSFFEGKKRDLERDLERLGDQLVERVLRPRGLGLVGMLREPLHQLDEVNFCLQRIEAALLQIEKDGQGHG